MAELNPYVTIQMPMAENKLIENAEEMIIYAIIYGFSQDGESWYYLSLDYLAKWCKCSKDTARRAVHSLTKKGLLIVDDRSKYGKTNRYRAVTENTISLKEEDDERVKTQEEFISLILDDKSEYIVTVEEVKKYQSLYPHVDIEQSFRSMSGWCEANVSKRKSRRGIKRFINSWLSREEEKANKDIDTAVSIPMPKYESTRSEVTEQEIEDFKSRWSRA